MPDKIPSIEDFNKDNILLRNALNEIHKECVTLAYLIKCSGEENLARKVEAVGIKALRAWEVTK